MGADEKFRLLRLFVKPPNGSLDLVAGEVIPPKEGCRSCVGCEAGCGFGALAYSDNIELFRSPRAFEVEVGFAAALEGRPIPAGCAFPKKSRPRSDSCGFAGLAAGAAGGGPALVGLA